MATGLALLIFITLTFVAALHAYWAFGGLWPGRNELSLARIVVGSRGITKMPSRGLTLIVALLIFVSGLIALAQVSILPALLPPLFQQAAIIGLAIVLLVRGTASFTPQFRRMQAEEPFATLDRNVYAPLCLALGAGFITLLLL